MDALAALFVAASIQFHLPSGLLSSICFIETKHQVNALHTNDGKSDSYGVCQIKLETAQWLGFTGTKEQLMEPAINVHYAAKYLARNLRRYSGHVEKAVIAYNRGHAVEVIEDEYAKKVFNQWRIVQNEI